MTFWCLSRFKESNLLRTVIFLPLHLANLHYTTLPTSVVFYPRGHVVLDLKSPVPVWFPAEEALGMLLVPNSGALSLKVIYTKRAKEYFFIGQLFRWSVVYNFCMSSSSKPFETRVISPLNFSGDFVSS